MLNHVRVPKLESKSKSKWRPTLLVLKNESDNITDV